MVAKKAKDRMREFVTERLEDSGLYQIVKSEGDLIRLNETPGSSEDPKSYVVQLIAGGLKIRDFKDRMRKWRIQDLERAVCFYKDGKSAMKRLGGSAKGRDDKSLKRYDTQDLNRMIHLRGLEKAMLEIMGSRNPLLFYFQPETERLSEAVREYNMKRVVLDYSHIDERDRRASFVENHESKDYKIAELITETDGALEFVTEFDQYARGRQLALLREH